VNIAEYETGVDAASSYIKKKYLVTHLNNRLQDRIILMPILSQTAIWRHNM
jgi:hypothetical protein